MYTKSFSDAHIQFLRGSMTLRALPGIELIHQVNVVKSAIVELRVWHNRWILEAVSFIYVPEDKNKYASILSLNPRYIIMK